MSDCDSEVRPPIPADIRRRVLVEAGHRCAIPTCRYIEVDVHHIVAWSQCKEHEYDNLIALCPNCHRRADRGEIDRKALRLYKFNLRFAHDKYSQIEMDVLFELASMPDGRGIPWLAYQLIFLKRLFDSGFLIYQEVDGGFFAGNVKSNPDLIGITKKGRDFVADLGFHEL
ncbi:MAG: HNH endonuclease [Beijerinckiaceae bacterium]